MATGPPTGAGEVHVLPRHRVELRHTVVVVVEELPFYCDEYVCHCWSTKRQWNEIFRNLPFCVRARRGSGCVFHRRKMRGVATNVYWKENVRKTKGNRSWRIYQIRELSLRLRKVLAPLTFVPKDNSLKLELCEIMYLYLYFFFIFEVDKSGALAPMYPPSKRKSDLRSSF